VPEAQVRVIGTLIGGGFGGKEDIMGQIHAALLAKLTGRPVKILYSRHESLLTHPKRHATTIRVKIGAWRDGCLVATEAELWGDTGAYASLGEKVLTRATTHAAGPYDVPNVKIDCYATYTNNPPAGAFRGFGVTQSCYAVESTLDELARELSLDPVELRRMNALRVGSTTNTGQVLRESVGLLECLDKVEKEVGKEAKLERPRGRKVRAWGLACAYKNTGLGGGARDLAGAEIEVYPDGHAEIRTSSAEIGQGLPGVLAAVTAEELGLPFESVSVLLSDTDLTPNGGPTTA
jgi:xanthine dehydrogenase molybdenum-binding subunit